MTETSLMSNRNPSRGGVVTGKVQYFAREVLQKPGKMKVIADLLYCRIHTNALQRILYFRGELLPASSARTDLSILRNVTV